MDAQDRRVPRVHCAHRVRDVALGPARPAPTRNARYPDLTQYLVGCDCAPYNAVHETGARVQRVPIVIARNDLAPVGAQYRIDPIDPDRGRIEP